MRRRAPLVISEVFILELVVIYAEEMNMRVTPLKDSTLTHKEKVELAAGVSVLGEGMHRLYELSRLIETLRKQGKVTVSPELKAAFLPVVRNMPSLNNEFSSDYSRKLVEIRQRIDAFFGFETPKPPPWDD